MRQLKSASGDDSFLVESIILNFNGKRVLTDAIVDTGANKTFADVSIAQLLGVDPAIRMGNFTIIQTGSGELKGASKEIDSIIIGDDVIESPQVVFTHIPDEVKKAMHNITVVLGLDLIAEAGLLGL